MPTLETIQDLIDHIRSNHLAEGIEKYYAEDVVMQDNSNPPVVGRSANAERERAFAASIERSSVGVKSIVIAGDQVSLAYVFDIVLKDGTHLVLDQVSVQQWKNDKIAHERFYYDSATAVQNEAA